MNPQTFELQSPVRSARFTVREDYTLALELGLARDRRKLVIHDFITRGGRRYYLFHSKTEIRCRDNTVTVRTAGIDPEDLNAPIPGLLVTYRFTFDADNAAFYVSCDYGSDVRVCDCNVKLLDVSWEDMTPKSFTGYEYDAAGKPFCHTFAMPTEPNPMAPDYETLMRITPHAAWERMKTRPHTFKKAVAAHADNGYLAVYGGTPTYHVEAQFISTFTNLADFDHDLRYFSGQNAPGAWFILEEPKQPEDLFALMEQLDTRRPALREHVFVPFAEKTVSVEAGGLKLSLLQTAGGVWVTPLYAGEEQPCQPWPLFYIDLWDTQRERTLQTDSGFGWEKVSVLQRGHYIRVTLNDPLNGQADGITVMAEAFLSPDLHRVSWKMRVVNRSDRWSVIKASYPQCLVHGFETGYVSQGSGMLFHEFNNRSHTFRGKYPIGVKVNMPYTAMYNPMPMEQSKDSLNGFYMGVHDPDGNPKFLYLAGAPQSDCTLMCAESSATYQRHAGNCFTLPGEMVWQLFGGDWFDATNIYREYVHAHATWLSPLRGRCDCPNWLRELPVWIMHFMPNENPDANPFPITLREKYPDAEPDDWYRTAVRFREEIGVPVCYHLYNWHWVPFNNDNPHYFPTHQDLKEGMRQLKDADIRVIPYMAGYSWDMCDGRGGDYRFETEALPNTAKDINGNVIKTSYASTEPTGQPVRFARMCPSTTLWKNEVRQVVHQLHRDFGMDGIYLDVVSTAFEHCCDETHLHVPGHSDFWWKAYADLITALRADAPDDFAIISESTSEVYSGILDGFLSWTWVWSDGVPAFSRIYNGRTAIFGRVITRNKRDDVDYCRFQFAQSLVYGQQLGWIHPEIVDDPVQFPFLKKMAQIRWDRRDFFAEAEMLRPAAIEGDMPMLNCEAFLRGQIWNHEKLVVTGAWEDASGNRSMFVINAGGTTAEVTLSVYEDEYNLPQSIIFDTQDGFELLGVESENGIRRFRCRIAGEGVGILNW